MDNRPYGGAGMPLADVPLPADVRAEVVATIVKAIRFEDTDCG